MMDLRELYQEIILDHNQDPRNCYCMETATQEAKGYNPLCGDKVTVYLNIVKGIVKEVSFIGRGCAISQASASLMTEAVKDKTVEEAQRLFNQFHDMLLSEGAMLAPDKLAVLAGVREFPARVKCATLAWHTLEAALKQSGTLVNTES